MKKENLISKWLDNNLNDEEKEAFDKLDASDSYRKIVRAVESFSGPQVDIEGGYYRLKERLSSGPRPKQNTGFYFSLAAAVLVIALTVYVFTNSTSSAYQADLAENKLVQLPDNSTARLNAGSKLTFDKASWKQQREVVLSGEAFFDVEEGVKFSVVTSQGSVSVLGTEFNVKDRVNFFEVSCFEGKVLVQSLDQQLVLSAGEAVRITGDKVELQKAVGSGPSWLEQRAVFKSVRFSEVLDELERQYDVSISGDLRYSKEYFSGSFSHINLETALQAVTIPLNLSYTISGNKIALKIND